MLFILLRYFYFFASSYSAAFSSLVRLHFDHSNLSCLSLIDKAVNVFSRVVWNFWEAGTWVFYSEAVRERGWLPWVVFVRHCHCLWKPWMSSAVLGLAKGCCAVHEVSAGLYWNFQNILDSWKSSRRVASCQPVYPVTLKGRRSQNRKKMWIFT